jgi:integrase
MTRSEINTLYLENIPIIHDFLTDECRLKHKQIRRYLLDLAVIYPHITKKYRTFEVFIGQTPNKKAGFFNDFLDYEYNLRMKAKPDRDKVNCRNRLLQIVWDVQGLLGYLEGVEGKNLRANRKLLETQTANPSFIPQINVSDLLFAFDEMPGEGRRRLKFLFWTTWNTIDVTQLSISDFKPIDTDYGHFYWIKKYRQKTHKKKIVFLNAFTPSFYEELDRYCSRNSIGENEPIFSRFDKKVEERLALNPCTFRAYFKYWAAKAGFNEQVGPKNIRALGIAQLRNVFKDDYELLEVWSQHHADIITTHYTQDLLNRFVERMPKIQNAVGIENVSQLKEQVKVLKDDISMKLDLHTSEIEKLKQKETPLSKEVAQETANEILKLIKRDM